MDKMWASHRFCLTFPLGEGVESGLRQMQRRSRFKKILIFFKESIKNLYAAKFNSVEIFKCIFICLYCNYFTSSVFSLQRSAAVLLTVCLSGLHVTFVKSAKKAIGKYVNIKNGYVNRYNIFLLFGAMILSHSVIMVNNPQINVTR